MFMYTSDVSDMGMLKFVVQSTCICMYYYAYNAMYSKSNLSEIKSTQWLCIKLCMYSHYISQQRKEKKHKVFAFI